MLTKDEFVKVLEFIKERSQKEGKFVEALESLSPSNYCNCFLYDLYEDKIIYLLKNIFDDTAEDISYFLYEMNYLNVLEEERAPKNEKGIPLYNSPETLYDYLTRDKSKDYKPHIEEYTTIDFDRDNEMNLSNYIFDTEE